MRFKEFIQEASDAQYVDFLEKFLNRSLVRSDVKTLGFMRNYTDMNGNSGILIIDSKTGERILMERPILSNIFQYPELLSWMLRFGAVELHDREEICQFVGSGFTNIVEK